jgi:CO/xanthine dehydrogenase FAD-binding subunit
MRLSTLEFVLEKKRVADHLEPALDNAIKALTPQDDWLGSSEYRSEMTHVLVRRVVRRVTTG